MDSGYLPKDARCIRSKWVYFAKRDSKGRLTRRRARVVAKGFCELKGIDYEEVFAPVAKYSTGRIMLTIAAMNGLRMQLLDVKAASLKEGGP